MTGPIPSLPNIANGLDFFAPRTFKFENTRDTFLNLKADEKIKLVILKQPTFLLKVTCLPKHTFLIKRNRESKEPKLCGSAGYA